MVSVYRKLISLKERLEETLQEIDSFYNVSNRLAKEIELAHLSTFIERTIENINEVLELYRELAREVGEKKTEKEHSIVITHSPNSTS